MNFIVALSCLLILIISGCSIAPAIDNPAKPRPQSLASFEDYPEAKKFIHLDVQQPHYPRRAQYNGVEAAVGIRFGIDKEGKTFNLEVIYTDTNEEWTKPFQYVSMKLASNFNFEPSMYNGQTVDTYDVSYLITYCVSEGDRTSLNYRAEACESPTAYQKLSDSLNTVKPSFGIIAD